MQEGASVAGLSPGDFTERELAEAAALVEPFSFSAGSVVVRQDAPAKRLYILSSGSLNLSIAKADGTELFQSALGPGEAVGEAALGDAPGYFGTATAVDDVRGYAVDVARLHDLRRDFAPVAFKVLHRLALGLCITIRSLNEQVSGSGDPVEANADSPRGPDGRTIPPSDQFLKFVRQMPFFEAFTDGEIGELASILKQWEVQKDHLLFAEGEIGNSCFIAVRGSVDVSVDRNGKRHRLAVLGPGRIFGEISLLDQGRRSATCRVVKDAVLIEIGSEEFQTLFNANSRMSFKFLEAVHWNLLAAHRSLLAEVAGQSIAAGRAAAQDWVLV